MSACVCQMGRLGKHDSSSFMSDINHFAFERHDII